MIMSRRARKVLDKTNLEQTLEAAWFVEVQLQRMNDNILIEGIENCDTVEELTNFAANKGSLVQGHDITNKYWLYVALQELACDFPYSFWNKCIHLIESDESDYKDALHIAIERGAGPEYALAIFDRKRAELLESVEHVRNTTQLPESIEATKISDESKKEWENIRRLL